MDPGLKQTARIKFYQNSLGTVQLKHDI